MHVRKSVGRLISAVALVTFALPLAVSGSTNVSAQTTGTTPPAAITDVASVAPPVQFLPIGTPATVAFTCGAQTFAAGTTSFAGPGCYNVTATAQDITTGSAVNFTSVTCGGVSPNSGVASPVNCGNTFSPVCPVGTGAAAGTVPAPGVAFCTALGTSTAATPDVTNQVVVTLNPGAPHAYTVEFTGYTPTTTAGSCPAGTTLVTVSPTISTGTSLGTSLPAATACRFDVEAQIKYVEVTNITLTPVAACGGSLTWAEGLKSYFGPGCAVNVVASGTVVLKTGVNCATGAGEPATGTAAPAEFGPKALYSCDANGNLAVTGVTGAGNTSLPGVSLGAGSTGVGSFTTVGSLGGLCAGAAAGTAGTTVTTTTSGAVATLCPTGPGAASLQLCLVGPGGTAASLPNNQPPLCSNTVNFNYTLKTARVVPQVRWAGEKIQLTKCFGIGLAGYPVEFTLQGDNPGLNATLLPPALASTTQTVTSASQNTIFTTADANGCATVIGLAAGEGVMYVDAAVYNTSTAGAAAGAPLVNEHAFQVFYLKFDHLDLENIKFQTYTVAQALQPYLGFLTGSPIFNGGAATGTSFKLPSAPGTGSVAGGGAYSVPLCSPDFVRAMVHGYFEMPGDPSGRPAAQVAIPGAATGSAGSYVLPAGRWVLPEDWPLLATFAGFSGSSPLDVTPSSVLAWDLNSGWVFNPTGEKPVLCGLAAGVSSSAASGNLLGGSPTPGTTYGNITAANVDVGPCFGQDIGQTGTDYYQSAPSANCLGGFTAGFGPFDPTRACLTTTNASGITNPVSGSYVIGTTAASCGATAVPCLAPTTPDSTYLPNGTLNQWDAPMPPAQVSFAITGGPGYLGQVSKTNLYQIRFDTGAGAPCPTGYTLYAGSNTCQLEIDPNPFYAEAIPASPLIPPVFNDGGYLWDSFGFTSGTTTVVRSTPAFTGVAAGGFVGGQSTSFTITPAQLAAAGATVAANGCPTFAGFAPATATIASATTATSCTLSGGANLITPIFGTGGGTASATPDTIVVADCRGFTVGDTVEVYDNTSTTGTTLGISTPIRAILPSPRTVGGVSFPNACELQFDTAALSFLPAAAPFGLTVISTSFGLPVSGAAAFQIGQPLTISTGGTAVTGGSTSVNTTVTSVDTTNNIVYVSGAESLAGTLSNCLLSRTVAGTGAAFTENVSPTFAFGACEPASVVAAGAVINSGPVGAQSTGAAGSATAPNLYPFWQWLPTPPTAGQTPTSATVYSDNHGEAVVTLNTAFQAQQAPVNGVCTAPYVPVLVGGATTPTSCLLQLGALGAANTIVNGTLNNVGAATSAFSASNPGCIQTFPSGTSAVVTGATVGASGPAAGQICVNSLGGVEFGASAYLGSTTVQAVADYPYGREHAQVASQPLTKVFTSAFAKTLTVSAGTPAPAGTTSYTVTVTATDVCGNPITGEPVELYALGASGSVVLAPLSVGALLSGGATNATVLVNPAGSANAGTATLSLEVLNNAALQQSGLVIKAVWPFEQIERFYTVIPGQATGQSATVVYPPGWQQVGGPAGSNFSVAEALFSYDSTSGQYANATSAAGNVSSAAPGCTGYWAYFAAAMAVSLPATSKSGDTAACTLAAGYNLVGNPFATAAKLPAGVTGFSWNGTSYDVTSTIGQGRSIWVYNDGTLNSLTLTAS